MIKRIFLFIRSCWEYWDYRNLYRRIICILASNPAFAGKNETEIHCAAQRYMSELLDSEAAVFDVYFKERFKRLDKEKTDKENK